MNKRVLLILVDGMRPDAWMACESEFLCEFRRGSTYSLRGKTMFPPVTLPCHASLFFSVDASRHGIKTNTWMPQVRPISSIADAASHWGRRCAMFYNWEQLRDLSQPGSMMHSTFVDMKSKGGLYSDRYLTEQAAACVKEENPDFVFLYLGYADEAGHEKGWMSAEYLEAVANAGGCIERIVKELSEEWCIIVTADHGGHERNHGLDMPEDMTIPFFFSGECFENGKELEQVDIRDIAPTIAAILEFEPPVEWEGHCVKMRF